MQARRPMRRQATLPPSLTGEDFRSLPSTSPCGRLRKRHRRRSVRGAPRRHLATRLFVEPEVFEAEAVVNAVDHHSHPLHLRVAARRLSGVEDNRTGAVLGQPPFDFPYQMLAFVLVGFGRLLIDQLVDFRTAIACVVALCGTDIVLVELLVGVVDRALADIETDSKIFAHDPRIPLRRVDGFKLTVDIDLLQLVNQDHRRIAVARDVACRHRDREPFVRAVAKLLQDLTGLGAVLGDIGIITWQCLEQLWRHAPDPFGTRQHGAADVPLALGNDVDKGFAIQNERHRASQVGIIEWRLIAVDDQGAVDVCRCHLADRLWHLALDILYDWDRYVVRRVKIDLAGDKCEVSRRYVFYDCPLNTVEIRPILLPVIRIPGHPDHLVRFKFDEFEGTGADRAAAHVARRYV